MEIPLGISIFYYEHWNRDGTTYPGWRSHGGMFPWLPSRAMQQGGTRLREDSLLPRRCLREAHFMQRLPV